MMGDTQPRQHQPPPPPAHRPNRTVVASFSSDTATDRFAGGNGSIGEYEAGQWVHCVCCGVASSDPGTTVPLSCALSDGTVNTYDRSTLQKVHSVTGAHRGIGSVTDLCHSPSTGPGGGAGDTLVISSGKDGFVRVFDLRRGSSAAAMEMALPRKEQALSVSVGYRGALAAVGGGKGKIHFFDLRKAGAGEQQPLGSYVDAHTEEATRVRFQPSPSDPGATTSLLVSASEDGLAAVHDTSKPSEEAALQSTMNVNTPLRDVGFFGPQMEGLYCLTGSETMSVWHHDSAQRVCDFGDVRPDLTASAGQPVEYLVGCHWDPRFRTLNLLCGNSGGDCAIFRVDAGSMTLSHRLAGGHRGVVRSFAPAPTASDPKCVVTGGEDARMCEWNLLSPPATRPTSSSPSGRASKGTDANVSAPPSSATAASTQWAEAQPGGGPARRPHIRNRGSNNAPY